MPPEPSPDRPFPRPVKVAHLPADGMETTIRATNIECGALARVLGLVAIGSLEAAFILKPLGSVVRVEGQVQGAVTQTCVVSLEPFETDIVSAVDLTFLPEPAMEAWLAKHKALVTDDPEQEMDDPPDPIIDGQIDLGTIAAEFLALALDPYPRKPGVVFAPPTSGEEPDPSPFAALARLKGNPRSE